MKKLLPGIAARAFFFRGPAPTPHNNLFDAISRPLSLVNCLNVALQQNAAILKAQDDLQAQYGVVIQTRAVALPQLTANGDYTRTERSDIENFPAPGIQPL